MVSSKILKIELELMKPFLSNCSIELSRIGQDKLGELMSRKNRKKLYFEDIDFENFTACMITPVDVDHNEDILIYIHGGGFVAGNIDYAKGFGSVLASELKKKVFCVAYRLAPEFKYPAAFDDCMEAYDYILEKGYREENIILIGESAGGGLILSMIYRLKEMNRKLPAGLIPISPWTDLTMSSTSFEINRKKDPSMDKKRLLNFAKHYISESDNVHSPFISPLYGEFTDFPPCIIFVGGDEVLLDDSRRVYQKLIDNNNEASIVIAKGMWHAYLLYGLKESGSDLKKIRKFVKAVFKNNGKERFKMVQA